MLALAFGDLHGRILALYDCAARWERENGRRVEAILQVGDFGVYPDPERVKENKAAQCGAGDYALLAAQNWKAPIPTWFCKGNNEDFEALERPLLEGLRCVRDGEVITLGSQRVAFLGGGWAPKSFAAEAAKPNHISRRAVERLMQAEFDVLVCHEAPAGTRIPGRIYAVGAPPLRELILEKQPELAIHGHHHVRVERMIGRTRVVGLDLLRPGSGWESAILPVEL